MSHKGLSLHQVLRDPSIWRREYPISPLVFLALCQPLHMLGCVIQLIPDQRMLFPLQGSELIMLYLGPASSIMVTQGLFWSNLLAFDTEQQSRTTEQVTGAEATARPPVHYLSFCPGKAKLPRRDQSLQSSHMPSSSFRKPALLESLQGQ